MHLAMILIALCLAYVVRWKWSGPKGNWLERWQRSLLLFLFPPLLLIVTAIAVLYMGPEGQMIGMLVGCCSYLFSSCFLGWALIVCFHLARTGWKTLQKTRTYRRHNVLGIPARLLNIDALFTAQIGFWRPELVVSKGLLQNLDDTHLEAVLAHEQAHYYYRDTFWFFWLGWMRQITAWLPNTEALWQELLILRELRADAKAAQEVDPLLLAEALLMVVSVLPMPSENFCAALNTANQKNRLEERIDALLAEPESPQSPSLLTWSWLFLVLLPLITVPFHS